MRTRTPMPGRPQRFIRPARLLHGFDMAPAPCRVVHAMMSAQQESREDTMHTLVPSDRVEQVGVYGRDGTKLGTIERLMLEKVSGTVVYAVIKTGGLLGSHHHYPVQWSALKYDPGRQAFQTELTVDELRIGPSEFEGKAFDSGDLSRSYEHPQYWTV